MFCLRKRVWNERKMNYCSESLDVFFLSLSYFSLLIFLFNMSINYKYIYIFVSLTFLSETTPHELGDKKYHQP